ncbi:peptidoglycan editing factor PgeF [Zophobihabitans entericus]|uniref:Purine nucleoside phosphorylase n=1 Tax=Zophobihabitans entericus TaxID=1635327 RepID=A0A6G9IC89_9GAMM|nr:peptidoglycan editing factor PgeF [Zophobihabitans entericus]QIQ21845.1 peptidoglycan editing factor PgeF [Zophobihabitans entericus]
MSLIYPDWPAPANIRAFTTTRLGGVSEGVYQSLNLGTRVGDDINHVLENRARLKQFSQLPAEPVWLKQTHTTDVVNIDQATPDIVLDADGSYSSKINRVNVVMTADCLPVLFCTTQSSEVAAAHAGWRGLCDGILEQTVKHFTAPSSSIMAWLGPAIGPEKFEVGQEVKQLFEQVCVSDGSAFKPSPTTSGKYFADIYELARLRLHRMGITRIYGGDYCTMTDSERFFSYRRDKQTGRMASLIWCE